MNRHTRHLPSHRLRLPDGRELGYVDYGDPEGRPVVLFHGLPGSRLQGHPDRSLVAALGIRLIAPDRPGYGLSDHQAGRTLTHWPDDMSSLADQLGLGRFAVVGISGGGPYAAACAWKIPQRLTVTVLVSSMGPADDPRVQAGMPWLNRLMLNLGRRGRWLLLPPAAMLTVIARCWPKGFLGLLNAHLPASDRAIYEQPEVQALCREDLEEAFRQGPRGAIRDILLMTRPWGFALSELATPVVLWHGECDTTVPIGIGRFLAASVPRCRARFIPEEGHFLFLKRWETIMRDAISVPPQR